MRMAVEMQKCSRIICICIWSAQIVTFNSADNSVKCKSVREDLYEIGKVIRQ